MSGIDEAIKIIKQGGVVIFPTDTAFGIGCSIENEIAVKRLFEIRKRPEEKAMPVLFDSITQVKNYIRPFDSKVEGLMKKYWPGALTIVFNCKTDKVPSLVRGGGDTLGVRIPDHELALGLIRGADVPIVGSSANFSGEKTPFTLEALDKSLIKLVDFVLEGKTKDRMCASTVIDCTKTPWQVIRQGEIMIDL
jgi:L-threonylcarbamoyladenylate synthase